MAADSQTTPPTMPNAGVNGYLPPMTRFRSALDVGAAIARKDISPVEVLDHYLAQTDAINPALNAFCLRDDDRARADASAAADELAKHPDAERSPLFGVPIPIKDLHDAAGWPTTHGSWGSSPDPVAADDLPVGRLRAAGLIFMGKTTAPELGTISFTESERLGITRNPWDTTRTPAGSSGGSGAAVASGMAPIGHASDGAGSIRSPASVNNLVGLKSSRNRITMRTEILTGGATQGALTRTVADTAAALDIMAAFDPGAFNNAPPPSRPYLSEIGEDPGRLRIAVALQAPLPTDIEPGVAASIEVAVAALSKLGHHVERNEDVWPDPGAFIDGFFKVWGTGSSGAPVDPERLEPLNKALREQGNALSSIEYVDALISLQDLTRGWVGRWGTDWDVLVTPTIAVEPPRVGACWEGYPEDPIIPLMNCFPMGVFTAPFNLTGLPAISLPLHITDSGLPIGVQFVAGPWREDLLIRLGHQLEELIGWPDLWPALAAD